MANEVTALREIRHTNVLKVYEIYEEEHQVYIVLEYLKGGELFEKIVYKGNYSEADAVQLMRKMLETISYCHSKSTLHRDLKPENIILTYLF